MLYTVWHAYVNICSNTILFRLSILVVVFYLRIRVLQAPVSFYLRIMSSWELLFTDYKLLGASIYGL